MDKYYYFISQLPTLYFDREPLISIPVFLEEAAKWLNRHDYEILIKVDLNKTSTERGGSAVWRDYRSFENGFRTDLAQWRELRRSGQEFKPSVFPLSLVKEGDPLEIEKKLLLFRWETIEEMEKDHHFDLAVLLLYYLKLQILHRLSLFHKEKGMEAFRNIVNAAYWDSDFIALPPDANEPASVNERVDEAS